jgi:uncharacterized protein
MAEAHAPLSVIGPERAELCLVDGVTLVADIYRPDAPERFPALLMRQPYGRRIASTVVLAHPAWYASHGYVVIVQDVRGRGNSGGAFRVLTDDAADGAATLAWAADHPACNGKVATYGFSYQAMTQLLALAGAAKAGTKRPDAMVPAMGAWSIRDDWVYEGGCFRLAASLGWAIQMAVEQARLADDHAAFDALMAAAGEVAAGRMSPRPVVMPLLDLYAPHYRRWLEDDAATFAASAPAAALRDVRLDLPSLCVGGWFDGMLNGTLATHAAFADAALAPQRLVVGPWPHIPWTRRPGVIDLGPAASSDIDRETIRFFDHHLKGRGDAGPAISLFDLVSKAWIAFPRWPASAPMDLHLASRGLAATASTDGRLVADGGGPGSDRLVHDPWRPAPLAGGHLGEPSGLQDRASIDDRTDVAVYTSDALSEPMRIAGPVACELHVDSDMPSHDLHCTLSMLEPDGRRAIVLTSGHLRLVAGAASGPRHVAMRATCATLPVGVRLRLSIQAAAWPAFAVNPATGARPEDAHPISAMVTTLVIRHEGSGIRLPVLS